MKNKNENNSLTDNTGQDTKTTVTPHSNSVSEIFTNESDPGIGHKKSWIAFVVLILGLILTVVAVYYVQRNVDENAKQDFTLVCDEVEVKIFDRLHAHAQLLRSSSALFNASNNVTRTEWKNFVDASRIDKNLPGIQGVGFSLIIPKNQLQQHIQNIRKQGFPNYTIYPGGDREVYTSIIYLEPFSGRNLRAFGYDMFSEPVRKKAMQQSCDANIAMLSGKVTLVQETKEDVQIGTLMYVPVYRAGMPANTIEQRRAAILGWVYSPYRMNDLMKGVLGRRWDINEKDRVHLQIYDDSVSAGSLLYDSQKNRSLKNNASNNQTLYRPVVFNEKKWVLLFTRYGSQISLFEGKTFIVLVSGILLSLLLFLLSISLINTRSRALQIAQRLTAELKENTKQYKDLSNLLESIIDHVPGLLFYKDKKNNFIRVNKTIALAIGKDKTEIEGKNLNEFYTKEEADKYYADDLEVINSGIAKLNFEEEWKTTEGTVWLNTSKIPFADAEEKIIGIIGMSMDITERKKIEIEREQFFKFFNISEDIMVIADPNGCFKKINPACLELLGYSENELLAKPFIDFVHPDDRQGTLDEMANQIKTGQSMNFENRYMCKDGTSKILSWRANYVAGEGITYATARDITQLKHEQEKFSASFHAAPYLIAITRISDGTIVEVNEGYTNLLGYSRDESIGKSTAGLSIWVDPVDRATFVGALEKHGQIDNFETKLKRKDGTIITVIDSARTITFQGETCTLSIVHDITERKHAEDIIRNAGLYNRSLIEASIDPLITIEPDGKITDVNNATEEVTGLLREQLIGSDFSNYFTEPHQANNVYKLVIEKGFVKDYPLTIRHADGKTTDVLYNATVYKNQEGEVVGVFAAARDITQLKQEEKIQMARNRLLLFANKHSVDEILEEALNEIEKITESSIGFCHFVNSDQNSLTLKNWSTRTKKEFCKAEGKDSHYEIEKAGVWVDCFYQQKPVIHNDYDSLPHKKGMPDGHAKVTRELAVPIMRHDKVVAILGIGNKPVNYTEKDVAAFSNLADLFWDIIERKQAEETIRNANLYNRSLIEASIDPLVTIAPDGKITDVNKATEKVTGKSREQLIGSDFSNYFTDPEQARNDYMQALSLGLVKDSPLTICHATGKTTDVLYNATVYKNEEGKVMGIFAAARDITESKKNEEALMKSESNLRAIFENTAKGFLLMDDKFTVIEFNSLMGKYIAISDNVILHKNENIFIDLPAERQDFLRTQFNTALDGEKVHYEISHTFSGNTIIYFEVKMYPVLDPEENVEGICISYEDITSRKLAEEQIIELNKDLDKKVQERTMQYELVNHELESFTFSVSHDLRAPLRAVNSYAQILEEDYGEKLDEDGKKMLKNIENNGKKMGRLIDDLLAFSRLGRKELKKDNVNMNDLTRAVVDELNQTFPNHAKIEIADLPAAHGDYGLLYQAMLNLMSNAIKYSSKKDKPVIKVFAEHKDGKTIFTIKDNGVGFDMRFTEKLFGVFQRLHSEEEFEGSGIGLAIVHRIILKHGGEVWGEGKVNDGATFYFTLN